MALDTATYLVSRDIAMRSGVINSRYRIADGRFVLSNKDLSLVRFTSDEYLTGLQGVERVSEAEAQRLIAENRFQRGTISGSVLPVQEQVQEEETVEEPTTENEEQVADEAPADEAPAEESDNENNEQAEEEE